MVSALRFPYFRRLPKVLHERGGAKAERPDLNLPILDYGVTRETVQEIPVADGNVQPQTNHNAGSSKKDAFTLLSQSVFSKQFAMLEDYFYYKNSRGL